jgi:hypothetical protein
MNVPEVPMAATKCVMRPPVCLMISAPVCSKCAFQFAGLLCREIYMADPDRYFYPDQLLY